MQAKNHTQRFLDWWHHNHITHIDLAIRRPKDIWIYHHNHALPATTLLAWARASNARRANIYIRPARGHLWPHLFLDDLPLRTAHILANHHHARIVHTSPHGGCHLHLICDRPISDTERHHLQRHLATIHGADPAATAGNQLQRLPGTRNWKRAGTWINLLPHHTPHAPPLATDHLLGTCTPPRPPRQHRPARKHTATTPDHSPSAQDWATVCTRLENGHHPQAILADLINTAAHRRGPDAKRYALRTLEKALAHIGNQANRSQNHRSHPER